MNLVGLPKVTIYSDGACSGNPGPGGWGALLQFRDKKKEIYGYEIDTTNNRMELQAVIKALQYLKKPCMVKVFTDSRYVQQGITQWIHIWLKNNWMTAGRSSVKNVDLWQDLNKALIKHQVSWQWVKGHADNEGNNTADRLAVIGKKIAMELAKCPL